MKQLSPEKRIRSGHFFFLIYLAILLSGMPLLHASDADSASWSGLLSKIKQYDLAKGSQGLYLHLDKTTYMQGESIWFTAYQLTEADSMANTLFVLLQKSGEDTAAEVSRFVMNEGLAKGMLDLSYSLPTGDYRLMAFTNVQFDYPGKPVFQQKIRVVSVFSRKYTLLKMPVEHSDTPGTARYLRYKVILDDGRSAEKGNVSFMLFSAGRQVAEGKEKLDAVGEFRVQVPAGYRDSTLRLRVLLKHGADRESFGLSVRAEGLRVNFFPESGHLLAGVPAKVAFEMKGIDGEPLTGSLKENGKVVARLQPDKRGRGVFRFTPRAGGQYTVQLSSDEPFDYVLPVPETRGMILSVDQDVVKDTLDVTISSSEKENTCYLLVHNYKELFSVRKYTFKETSMHTRIPLAGVTGKGVLTLTLLDAERKPLAERCIFLKDPEPVSTTIRTELPEYRTRQKVKLKVQLKDRRGNAVKGLFSIGCAAVPDRDSNTITSLAAFWYAGQYLPVSGIVLPSFDPDDTVAMSMMLQIEFWTKYRWESLMQARPFPVSHSSESIAAQFFYDDEPLKQPLAYGIVSDDSWQQFATDSQGRFDIRWNSLYAPANTKIGILPLMMDGKAHKDITRYQLRFDWTSVDAVIRSALFGNLFPEDVKTFEEAYVLKGKHLLKEVKITDRPKRVEHTIYVSTDCRDYVCLYNIFNCPNHRTGTKPVYGKLYRYYASGNTFTEIYYAGCEDTSSAKFLSYLNGTWKNKEFYVIDFERDKVEMEEKHSTIFWSHQVVTNNDGEAELEFFTNDLSGNFILHLQGFSNRGPLSGTSMFRVKSSAP